MASTLGAKIGEGHVTVLESLDFPEAKTKNLANLLGALGLKGKVLLKQETKTQKYLNVNPCHIAILRVVL